MGERDEEMGSMRAREREALQDQDTVGRWREGNLLVFAHQLGRRGDMERMEGDAS